MFFLKFRSHLKILGAKMVTWSKFHTEEPKMLGATAQNLVVRVTWRPGFVYPCSRLLKISKIVFSRKGFSTKNLCAFLICLMCCNRNREYYGPYFDHPNYKVVQIWPGQTVTCLHTNRPGHIWTTLYIWWEAEGAKHKLEKQRCWYNENATPKSLEFFPGVPQIASVAVKVNSSFFWVITRHNVVWIRRFETVRFQESSCPRRRERLIVSKRRF